MATRLENPPYKKNFPSSMTPFTSSIWLTYLGLTVALLNAVFLSRLSLIDWETYQRMSDKFDERTTGSLERLATWGFASDPWLGLLWGTFVGTILILRLNAEQREHLDYYAERLIRRFRIALRGFSDRRIWAVCGWVIGFMFVDLAGAFVLNVNPKTATWGLFVPMFLSYRVRKDVYNRAKEKYAAALEEGLIAGGSLRPSRAQSWGLVGALIVSIAIPVWFSLFLATNWNELGEFRDLMLSMEGITCTPEEALALEERLEDDPDDRDVHLLLTAYYGHARFEAPEDDRAAMREAFYRHTLWLVEHSPETRKSILLFPRDGEAYADARRLWLRNIETHSRDPRVLMNAANFFDGTDPGLAEEILQKGQALEPDNPEWNEQINELRLENSLITESEGEALNE